MERYALFAGHDVYEPMGGMHDLVALFSTYEEALEEAGSYEWFDILDRETFTVVGSSR